ncbi:MAG: tetratricopeptide repeat protein [Acidobacteria bacterium]|nr:tetratricopeptide repeat protein [Acidobacteriota bacterium]
METGIEMEAKGRIGKTILSFVLAGCAFAQTTTIHRGKHTVNQAPDDQSNEITRAEEAIQKQDFAAAEPLLKKALAQDPKNYQAWFDLGFIYNRLGRTEDSIHAYRQSVAAKPDVFESNLNLGLMLARSNNPAAEPFLRAAAKLKPTAHVEEGQARAWASLGHLLENTNPDEALDAYQKAAALTPKDPEPHLSAGLLRERRKDFLGAEKDYKEVLALDPKSNDAVIGLTNIYMKSGRMSDAEPLLRQLSASRPDDAGLHLQLGRVLAAAGRKDEAIPEIQAALKLTPNDAEAQRDLAELQAQSANPADAEKAYRELLKASPNDGDVHNSLGEILLKQKRFPEAEEEFRAAVKLKPDFGNAYGNLAIAADENKDYPLAIRALDVRDKLLPPTTVGLFMRATAFDHLRDYKQASVYYHLFLDAAKGQYPDQEWQAKHRLVAIEPKRH